MAKLTEAKLAADGAMREIWAEWFSFYQEHFRGRDIAISAADQMAFYEIAQPKMFGLASSTVEQCAAVCDKHAEWSENRICDDEPAESTCNQIFATISNTANDCAAMIRDLKGPAMTSTPHQTLLGDTHWCGHGMMASICPTCSPPPAERGGAQ